MTPEQYQQLSQRTKWSTIESGAFLIGMFLGASGIQKFYKLTSNAEILPEKDMQELTLVTLKKIAKPLQDRLQTLEQTQPIRAASAGVGR